MLGGLLSAHIIATDESDILGVRLDTDGEYGGELLRLARELGHRLLPAFEASPSGIPFARTNLKHGAQADETTSTCAAGFGTLLLEFGTLSRLTNETIFEDVARLALAEMWAARSKQNLFGNTYDLKRRAWTHSVAGISAGVDSIYEYMFKGYVYFGGHEYLRVFEAAYNGLLQYSRDTTGGYAFYNVHMRTGEIASSWIDALSAYFPGLMVLAGDVDGAESAYMLYYHIWNRFRAMPERFNLLAREPDILYYLLRPEFIESTYYLYRATLDPFYLDVGEMILTDMNELMRTSCGYASIHDVLTHTLEDRMDSYVLSETFKYLYLLFDEDNPLHRLDNGFVFTTEGHVLLPLSPVRNGSAQYPRHSSFSKRKLVHDDQLPALIKPALRKVDNIRRRLGETHPEDMFAFPIFPSMPGSDNATQASLNGQHEQPRKCPVPRLFGLTTQSSQDTAPKTRFPADRIAAEWKPLNLQSPLERLHAMQRLNRALQSPAGHSMLYKPYLLSLHATIAAESVPLRNDYYNVGALVYQPVRVGNATVDSAAVPPARNGTAVTNLALAFGQEFDAMCSVSSHLFLSQRHEVWKSALVANVDTQGTLDLPGDADTWLSPNTRQVSITDYMFARATTSQIISVDVSFHPKGRQGLPLFRDIQFEQPDLAARMSLAEFFAQQREQLKESDWPMYAMSPIPPRKAVVRRRGYFPQTSDNGQQPQRRLVFTNGAGQVMTDSVVVRTSSGAAQPKYAGKSGGDASSRHIVPEPTNNWTTASKNAVYNSSAVKRKQRSPHDRHRRREYAGRLAYFSEMSLYRSSEPALVPQPTVLTMLHLRGSSAIYGCEEYTPREQRLFAGKVIAARVGGGCSIWEKAIHAMNAGASALLVDTVPAADRHNRQRQREQSAGNGSVNGAAINASGSSQHGTAYDTSGSATHRLTDRLQHICAWRTVADDKCWPEDQYAGASLYPELRRWSRWLLRQRQSNADVNSALQQSDTASHPISMPVVIVDSSVIDEIEEQLIAGCTIQVELL
ncbi:hypothetical protein H4S01_002551 [Coemansia sp. RSA 2610]|nr:hypothetical protein H4S01_002551 [Coemansia sp. RSA 2610]